MSVTWPFAMPSQEAASLDAEMDTASRRAPDPTRSPLGPKETNIAASRCMQRPLKCRKDDYDNAADDGNSGDDSGGFSFDDTDVDDTGGMIENGDPHVIPRIQIPGAPERHFA
ncbi:hypothetical protein ElyMa_005392000 [Elysia marginata]|uniref:Uncharacterized protein n=1 Tax=Elysia marginata TaxID=1093978 RepID=A0AAV4EFA6_9GAST|nr:hypothetical protein ElyMa_005392000 [Elysia marginata]